MCSKKGSGRTDTPIRDHISIRLTTFGRSLVQGTHCSRRGEGEGRGWWEDFWVCSLFITSLPSVGAPVEVQGRSPAHRAEMAEMGLRLPDDEGLTINKNGVAACTWKRRLP